MYEIIARHPEYGIKKKKEGCVMFKAEFRTSSAAFEDPDGIDSDFYKVLEVKRILKRLCVEMATGESRGTIMDRYDNLVGQWSID